MNADDSPKSDPIPSAVPIPRLDLVSPDRQPPLTNTNPGEVANLTRQVAELTARLKVLQDQEKSLRQEVNTLQAKRNQLSQSQPTPLPPTVELLVQEGLKELEQRKQSLQVTIEQLERRQERIRNEMKTTFAGVSQDLAIRVQSFKEYLVGSLQDLVNAAEQMELVQIIEQPTASSTVPVEGDRSPAPTPKFAERSFAEESEEIQALIDQYRLEPDYYGPPWQLRRTFEPIHAERVSTWFFTQGGRGALRSMGSRMQNVIVASAIISILDALYGDRLRVLVLVTSPERMGEWRRGLQDCLGLSRTDFGPDGGVVVFESAETLITKADRFQKAGDLPLIVIDETENLINLGLLQFPLWLAFAPDPQSPSTAVFDW